MRLPVHLVGDLQLKPVLCAPLVCLQGPLDVQALNPENQAAVSALTALAAIIAAAPVVVPTASAAPAPSNPVTQSNSGAANLATRPSNASTAAGAPPMNVAAALAALPPVAVATRPSAGASAALSNSALTATPERASPPRQGPTTQTRRETPPRVTPPRASTAAVKQEPAAAADAKREDRRGAARAAQDLDAELQQLRAARAAAAAEPEESVDDTPHHEDDDSAQAEEFADPDLNAASVLASMQRSCEPFTPPTHTPPSNERVRRIRTARSVKSEDPEGQDEQADPGMPVDFGRLLHVTTPSKRGHKGDIKVRPLAGGAEAEEDGPNGALGALDGVNQGGIPAIHGSPMHGAQWPMFAPMLAPNGQLVMAPAPVPMGADGAASEGRRSKRAAAAHMMQPYFVAAPGGGMAAMFPMQCMPGAAGAAGAMHEMAESMFAGMGFAGPMMAPGMMGMGTPQQGWAGQADGSDAPRKVKKDKVGVLCLAVRTAYLQAILRKHCASV